jgi:hypothetical protein
MSSRQLVDPELCSRLELLPSVVYTNETLPFVRCSATPRAAKASRLTRPRRAPKTCPACRRPTSPSARLIFLWRRTWNMRGG